VDLATYKAEFLHHHYQGRLRPRSAYAMGLVPWWARLASRAPGLANSLASSRLLKKVGGIAPQRSLPAFAHQTFRDWFRKRPWVTGEPVLLWPDTFTNFFEPGIGQAAVAVLEAAGCRVTIPRRILCCGRPLYDFGLLDLARRQLRQILDALEPEITAGIPVVGLEPSCVAVFRDELPALFPGDEAARRLSARTFTLAELLLQKGWEPPRGDGQALVHGHCHHQAVMGLGADRDLLARTGLEVRVLDAGCCGMAGAFGFEQDHYDLSLAIGERVLLPAVREASPETLILADGFSCRQQIVQTTNRKSIHLAELLRRGLGPEPFV
jgi:Fe-S oxidoreductase